MANIFTSKREQKLWLWLLVVLMAIYSTLGVAQSIAAILRERNLLQVSFLSALVITGVTLVVWWIKRQPHWSEIVLVISVILVYLMVMARIASPEERTHLIEYSIVTALIYQALQERNKHKNLGLPIWLFTLAISFLLGWIDEGIQALLPNRVYDLRDVGFNLIASIMAISVIYLFNKIKGIISNT